MSRKSETGRASDEKIMTVSYYWIIGGIALLECTGKGSNQYPVLMKRKESVGVAYAVAHFFLDCKKTMIRPRFTC